MTRNILPLLFIVLGHLFLLVQGAMLGCGFHSEAANPVADDMDAPNAYTCSCRCSASPTLNVRLSAAFDDVEAPQTNDPDGIADLDFGGTGVGLRFTNLAIPPGAVISAATVQFTADDAFGADNTTPLDLDIVAEAADNAPPFAANIVNNLDTLPRTAASIAWHVAPWAVSQAGPAQRTPDLSSVIQEVVSRPGWRAGNALTLILGGSGGRREAESFDGNPARAAVLTVQFEVAPVQALNVCMPAELNPNLKDANGMNHPAPQEDQLRADCEGRVQKTFADLAMACGYPAACDCDLTSGSQQFNVACNDTCAEVKLDPTCANFNPPLGNVGATNAPGDQPVCVLPLNSAGGASAIAAAMFGQQSECRVEGPATINVADEEKKTRARGVIGLLGRPCPETECSVGLTYGLNLDPITFEVRFHSDPKFEDLTTTGASAPDAGFIDPAGLGLVPAQQTDSSARGRRDDDTRAFELTNPSELGLLIGWEAHVCGLFGDLAGTVADDGDQGLTASVTVQGEIVNEPPHADAGEDQVLECTSPDGATLVVDGTASSDPEDNAVLFSWFRDSRVGPSAGFGETAEVQQELGGAATYVLRVIDAFGQSDEDTTTVEVMDTTPPELSLAVSPAVLWPPTHQLVPVTVSAEASDVCDPSPTLRLVSITSNEGDLADGSGHTSPDIQDAQFGTDDRQFLLRAERRGGGSGRIYTITYEAEDADGNVATREVIVAVPKS